MKPSTLLTFPILICSILLLWSLPAFSAHPLLTEDTFTQGKGKTQIEASYKYDRDDDNGVKAQSSQPQFQVA